MVGGDADAVAQVEPVFRDLAPKDGYAHAGPSGAGHFTKMVHDGIEYGLMQAYAERFDVLRGSEFDLELARDRRHLALWIGRPFVAARAAVRRVEQEGGHLETIRGYVDDSGEGRWTIAEAIPEAVPLPVITAALSQGSRRGRTTCPR